MNDWIAALVKSKKEKKVVAVDFFSETCHPCRFSSPEFGRVSTGNIFSVETKYELKSCNTIAYLFIEYEDIMFLKVDVEKSSDIADVSCNLIISRKDLLTYNFFVLLTGLQGTSYPIVLHI